MRSGLSRDLVRQARCGKSASSRKRVNPANPGGRCNWRRMSRGRSRRTSDRRWFAHGGGPPGVSPSRAAAGFGATHTVPSRRRPRVFLFTSHGWYWSCAERSQWSPSSADWPPGSAVTISPGKTTAAIIRPITRSVGRHHLIPRLRHHVSRRLWKRFPTSKSRRCRILAYQ